MRLTEAERALRLGRIRRLITGTPDWQRWFVIDLEKLEVSVRKLWLLGLLAGSAAVIPGPASAILQFSADVNGNVFNCVDNTACDTNPLVGTITTGTLTFGALTFLGSAQTQTTGALNTLDTTSFQITNNGATTAPISIAVGGTDFVGPVASLSESASGTWQNAAGSTIDNSFYADAANTQGAGTPSDHPGVLQADSGLVIAVGLTDSFQFNHTSSFTTAGLYSMTLQTDGTLVGGGGQLTGRSQAIVAVNTPEPASLAIFGVSLLGLGLVRRRFWA